MRILRRRMRAVERNGRDVVFLGDFLENTIYQIVIRRRRQSDGSSSGKGRFRFKAGFDLEIYSSLD